MLVLLLALDFFFLGEEERLSSLSTSFAARFLEEETRFFAALRTLLEILASCCWNICWSSSALALEMLSMLVRLAFWRAWTLARAVARGTLASWVRKRSRVGRSVVVLILLLIKG